MNTFWQIEDTVAQMMDSQISGSLSLSIALFLNSGQWLKGEIDGKEYLVQLNELCEHAELTDKEDWDKLRTFIDQLLVMQFYGGKAQLLATKRKQEEYRRMFSRAYYDCYLYLLEWFDEETEEINECIPYSEYLWDDFQLCVVSEKHSRVAFWQVMLGSYKILNGYKYLPIKPLMTGVFSKHSKEVYIFRNRWFAYLFQLVVGLTVLCSGYFVLSMGKLLYNLLVMLPYNRLLLYSGAKVYGDNINEYLTLKHQLGSVLFANRECLIGIAIGTILLLSMNIVYQYKRIKI